MCKMNVQNNQFQQLNQKYLELCKKYSLNPSVLKDIVFYRSKGYNNSDIANMIGVHRVTVQNYVEKLREMEQEDFGKALLGVLTIIGGAYVLSKLFEDGQ